MKQLRIKPTDAQQFNPPFNHGTKCTQVWNFFNNSRWYTVTILPIYHDMGTLQSLGLRPLLALHAHTHHHHSHHRGNVTAPYGRPNPRSRLHHDHNQEGGDEIHKEHVVALDGEKHILSISLNIIELKLKKKLNKGNILTSIQSIYRITKKVAKIILKISVQIVPSSQK
jgi:hypothetical protein